MKRIIILFLLVMFLISCAPEEEIVTVGDVFMGGEQGLVAVFEPLGVEEEGIYTIYEEDSFPVAVTLTNKGEEDVEVGKAKVILMGQAPGDYEGIEWEKSNEKVIEKVSEFNPYGGEEVLTFASEARYLPEVTGYYDANWFASYEYDYKTYVIVPKVCFKENPRERRICEVKEAKTFFVSGAPIKVTSVVEDLRGRGIMALKFEVADVGDSVKVTKVGEEFDVRFDKIGFEIEPGVAEAEKEWECKSGGDVDKARLTEGKATIICWLKEALAEDTLYTKEVALVLSYKYQSMIRTTLRIKATE